jgi:hypothetical protein
MPEDVGIIEASYLALGVTPFGSSLHFLIGNRRTPKLYQKKNLKKKTSHNESIILSVRYYSIRIIIILPC